MATVVINVQAGAKLLNIRANPRRGANPDGEKEAVELVLEKRPVTEGEGRTERQKMQLYLGSWNE